MPKSEMTGGIVVVGAGGHGKVVISTARAAGVAVRAVLDEGESVPDTLLGVPVIATLDDLVGDLPLRGIIAVGDNETRCTIASRLGLEWITLIHPYTWVDPSAEIGLGSVLCAGSIVQPGSVIGGHVIVNTRSTIDHDCRIGDYAHVSASHVSGGATVGPKALIGVGSTVLPGRSVGAGAVVGGGSVVVSDVPPGAVVIGVPARPRG